MLSKGDLNKEERKVARKLITELDKEHTGAGDILKELEAVTDYYYPPADDCRTYALAYQKLQDLERDLF